MTGANRSLFAVVFEATPKASRRGAHLDLARKLGPWCGPCQLSQVANATEAMPTLAVCLSISLWDKRKLWSEALHHGARSRVEAAR